MRILIAIALLAASSAFADPFLVSDPESQAPEKCMYQVGSGAVVETNTVANACKIDLAPFPVGVSNMQVWYRYTRYGNAESPKSPFVLNKPDATIAPASLRISP